MKNLTTAGKTLYAGIILFGLTVGASAALGDSGAFFSTDFGRTRTPDSAYADGVAAP